jgi:hypothetical protein
MLRSKLYWHPMANILPKLSVPRVLALSCVFVAATTLAAGIDRPSRAASKGCAWEKLTDSTLGLAAWVQRCDYGFRKIDFLIAGKSLAIRYSDGGAPEPVINVLDLLLGETPQDGIKRVFAAHTEPALAARCRLAEYKREKPPAGVKRYTFVPRPAYQKEVDAKSSPDEVGDPACGDWGDMPDGIQYFETRPGDHARKVLFVRAGQDEPLFDEKTLHVIAPVASTPRK